MCNFAVIKTKKMAHNNAEITQVVFSTTEITYELFIMISGFVTRLEIDHNSAKSIIESYKGRPQTTVEITISGDLVYYIFNPKK